jgi:hypothetical protein
MLGLVVGLANQAVGSEVGDYKQGYFSGNIDFRGVDGSVQSTPGEFSGATSGSYGSAEEIASAASFADAFEEATVGPGTTTSIGRDADDYSGSGNTASQGYFGGGRFGGDDDNGGDAGSGGGSEGGGADGSNESGAASGGR